MTALYRAYVALSQLALPIAARIERSKLDKANVADRAKEKLGNPSQDRPQGQLIWFHAASVGESLSVLSLITQMGALLPKAEFLITSGTATSATLVEQRMPPRCRHQFAPLDAPGPLTRFLGHWRPDAGIFVESELWPQMLKRSNDAGLPLALVNARLSDRSLAGWAKRPKTAAVLFQCFRVILTQTEALRRSLIDLGAPEDRIAHGINLKSLSAPLPIDDALRVDMQTALANRPVWIAASTHPGEENTILDAHKRLLAAFPDLCLILAPRHPDRGDEVADLVSARGWTAPRRSTGALPEGPVYLADSLGELGTWYALAPIVFLGGSLLPIGGHNPFETAQSGVATLSGPHVTNFADTYAEMTATGAARLTQDAAEIAAQVETWLSDPSSLNAARDAAKTFTESQSGQIMQVAEQLIAELDLGPVDA